MAEDLYEFVFRVPESNTSESFTAEIPAAPDAYRVASLKGGQGINVVTADSAVWLQAIVGWEAQSITLRSSVTFSIYRNNWSDLPGSVLIYSSQDSVGPSIGETLNSFRTTSVTHVDVPGVLGPVDYYLEASVTSGLLSGSNLILPVTFIGAIIDQK